MSSEQLINRIISQNSMVSSQKMRNGDLSDSEWANIVESANIIGNSNIIIDDTPGISIGEMRSKCRKFKLEKDIQLVIVDYLQLMTTNGRSSSREQEIAEISRTLKGIARELNVPVIALSPVSYTHLDVYKRQAKEYGVNVDYIRKVPGSSGMGVINAVEDGSVYACIVRGARCV